jgi:hypothetical protein
LMDNIKMNVRVIGWGGIYWLVWLRIGTSGWLLWTFGFHKMVGNSWVASQQTASQQGLCSMELVTRALLKQRPQPPKLWIYFWIPWIALFLFVTFRRLDSASVFKWKSLLCWTKSLEIVPSMSRREKHHRQDI